MVAMAIGGRRVETYYGRDLLEVRTTLHLAVRLAVRANQVLLVSGAAVAGAALWHSVLPAFVLLDVVTWWVLRRSDRFGLAWRLPLDALDAAFWTLSPRPLSGHYDWAVLIAVPLALEAGVRMGWRSFVVPATITAATAVAAETAGKPIRWSPVWWVVLAVLMGMAFYRYCRHLDERAEQDRRRQATAARRRAYLAGQNQVAMGASSAVDAIEGLVPVLGRPRAGSALSRLADGWKSQLSASTAQEANYLQVALLEWERVHNLHPDLSSLVEVRVAEGQGTTLLTATQARQLVAEMERLGLRGRVAVRLRDAETPRLPGQVLRLEVGGRPLVVPADPRGTTPPIDPCAVTYFYLATLLLVTLLAEFGGAAPLAVALGIAMCAVAGTVSHRRIVTHGERARLGVFVLAVAVATILTLLAATMRHPVTRDGDPILPFGTGLLLLSFLGGFYWPSLARWRWLMPTAFVANVALGVAVFAIPSLITARALAASVIYNGFPVFPCGHLARALERAASRHAAATDVVDEGAERDAFLEGREAVVNLVRQAHDDAMGELRLVEPRLDASVAALAAARLEEVERRLRTIESESESSWSTTTR